MLVAGCGPGPSAAGGGATPRPKGAGPGPTGVPEMRALLERYSPTGHYVVTTYESLPTRWRFGNSTIDLTSSDGFADYFKDESPRSVVENMGTAVHETYHGYGSLMAYKLLADSGGQLGAGAEAVYVDREPMLVVFGPTFPAREMDATFPADARTYRYETYIAPSNEIQSTQVQGVFGLLDELAAYYHGARTVVDLWPWVRDEAPADSELLVSYAGRFHEIPMPLAEFQLYILHYLVHARDHRRDVYDALMANRGFRAAFIAVVDGYTALLAEADAIAPKLDALLRERGAGDVRFLRLPGQREVRDHLATEPYRSALEALR